MCQLNVIITSFKTAKIYKVVAKSKTGRYFSPATRIEYLPNMKIPVKKDKVFPMTSGFFITSFCLKDNEGYSEEMEGRTSGFISKEDAEGFLRTLYQNFNDKRYKLVTIEMKISNDLMKGNYGGDDVIAGKYINTIEEL